MLVWRVKGISTPAFDGLASRFPVLQRVVECDFDRGDGQAGVDGFCAVQNTVGARSACGDGHELILGIKELEVLVAESILFDQSDNLPCGDKTRIGQVVDAKRNSLRPARNAAVCKFIQV